MEVPQEEETKKRKRGSDTNKGKQTKRQKTEEEAKPKKVIKYIVLSRGLSDEDTATITDDVLNVLPNCRLLEEVDNRTTHVVVSGGERTVKALQGIASGLYLVKPAWIIDSGENKEWLPEDEYEADDWFPAGKVARLGKSKKEPGLFQDIKFYVGPSTKMKKQDLEKIIMCAGGKISSLPKSEYCISGNRPQRKVIMTGESKRKKVVSETWVFDALTTGCLPHPRKYAINYKELEKEAKKQKEESLKQLNERLRNRKIQERDSEDKGEDEGEDKGEDEGEDKGEEDDEEFKQEDEEEDDDDPDVSEGDPEEEEDLDDKNTKKKPQKNKKKTPTKEKEGPPENKKGGNDKKKESVKEKGESPENKKGGNDKKNTAKEQEQPPEKKKGELDKKDTKKEDNKEPAKNTKQDKETKKTTTKETDITPKET